MATSPISFLDLFAGCGGLGWGLSAAGLVPVGAVEVDPAAAATYAANVDRRVVCADISQLDDFPAADLVVGGPPCQGFSQIGKGRADDPRNRLWRHYLRALVGSGAQVFVMENVPQLLVSDEFARFRALAEEEGFHVEARVLDAADYGVPQHRRRAIIIGSRHGRFGWPEPTHGEGRLPYVTVREALVGLSAEPDGRNWHRCGTGLHADTRTMIAHVPADGGNRFQMERTLDGKGLGHLVPDCLRRNRTGAHDTFARLWWDQPARTIRTDPRPSKGRYLHPSEDRAITVREAARLQSFPDNFHFDSALSLTRVQRQIGNAVPPLLAEALGRALDTHLAVADSCQLAAA